MLGPVYRRLFCSCERKIHRYPSFFQLCQQPIVHVLGLFGICPMASIQKKFEYFRCFDQVISLINGRGWANFVVEAPSVAARDLHQSGKVRYVVITGGFDFVGFGCPVTGLGE